ncbi:hypothetical protein [Halolamina salifodinae]|uniref:Putative membrane protein n=1 Tax=Halolamina salifodinae TaxID=1202767 RepID=A0A8T4GSN4_9EURY|nr:hypothetical protein [Halolamina salifodinae]MBP1985866.1 putative membrane protein [Halolamina salifodinae]
MPSPIDGNGADADSDADAALDPETEAAVRRIINEERNSPLSAVMQVLGGALFALLVVPVLLGLLVIIGIPVVGVAAIALLGLLAAIAYGWALPPFR